jgi:hypothetical protein
VPAAWCGIVAFKPTSGRISMQVLSPIASIPLLNRMYIHERSQSSCRAVAFTLTVERSRLCIVEKAAAIHLNFHITLNPTASTTYCKQALLQILKA